MSKASKPGRIPKTIVYACCGGSDTGELALRVARRLVRDGAAEMHCLTAVAAGLEDAVRRLLGAGRVFVIDGCDQSCARTVLDRAGRHDVKYLGMQELGLRKHDCPVTEEQIAAAVDTAVRLINL